VRPAHAFTLLALLLAGTARSEAQQDGAAAAPVEQREVPDDCATIEQCIARLMGTRTNANRSVSLRLVTFGDAAVSALIPFLADRDLAKRELAGTALSAFQQIDARHLPAFIHAYRYGAIVNHPGNIWMAPAIAAIGTDEALDFLLADYFGPRTDPFSSPSASRLARFGDRLRPAVLRELAACGTGADPRRCGLVFNILEGGFEGAFETLPEWAVAPLVALAETPGAPADARHQAEEHLDRVHHPLGLRGLLWALSVAEQDNGNIHYQIDGILQNIAEYGSAGVSAGPAIMPYLDRIDLRGVPAEAALTLGAIGYRPAVPKLLAIESLYRDNWLLAYNAADSLGRLRAAEARPLLEALARTHWHLAVRHNAERALNMLAGGDFARPGVADDLAPAVREENLVADEPRYRSDQGGLRWCGDADESAPMRIASDPVGWIHWPRSGAREIALRPSLEDRRARDLARDYPNLPAAFAYTAYVPLRSGFLLGYTRGAHGAGMVHVRDDGRVTPLLPNSVFWAFRMGGKLYVLTGFTMTMVMDGGWADLWQIEGDPPRLARRITLSSSPGRVIATADRHLIIETGSDQFAIREDGVLVDPGTLGACAGRG